MNKNSVAQTNSELAYEKLKEWILDGTCPPGEKINQDLYAKKLGVSRLPLRSALERLASENLIVTEPRHGSVVSPVSIENLTQIFNLRCILEPLILLEAAENGRKSDFMKVREMLEDGELEVNNLKDSLGLNRNFHFGIYNLAKNNVLSSIVSNLWDQSFRYRIIFYETNVRVQRVSEEHYKIVDLLIDGKKNEAAELLRKHTKTSQEELTKKLMH